VDKPKKHFMSRDHSQICLKVGGACMWLPGHLCNDPNLSLLANPDRLFAMPQCEIIKDQKKIKVGRVPVEQCLFVAVSVGVPVCSVRGFYILAGGRHSDECRF